jgi:hypothetical protein
LALQSKERGVTLAQFLARCGYFAAFFFLISSMIQAVAKGTIIAAATT